MSEVGKVRKLSRFLCQELMYDYASEELDKDRRAAMDNYLKDDPDSRKELEATVKAMKYCGRLAETQMSEPLIAEISEHKSLFERGIEKLNWKQWPEFLKWGSEAFVISLVVAVIAILLPWETIQNVFTSPQQQITLAEMESVVPDGENLEPVDVSAPPPTKESSEKTIPPQAKAKQPVKKAVAVAVAPKPKPKPKPKPGPMKGTLYRAYMDLNDLDNLSPDLVNLISSLGGKKAGKVRLGWKKPKGRYFHFSMPDTNYDGLLQKLRDYGPVRIYKNPHSRIMPEGKIRIILWIEDKGPSPLPTPAEPVATPAVEQFPVEAVPASEEASDPAAKTQ